MITDAVAGVDALNWSSLNPRQIAFPSWGAGGAGGGWFLSASMERRMKNWEDKAPPQAGRAFWLIRESTTKSNKLLSASSQREQRGSRP